MPQLAGSNLDERLERELKTERSTCCNPVRKRHNLRPASVPESQLFLLELD